VLKIYGVIADDEAHAGSRSGPVEPAAGKRGDSVDVRWAKALAHPLRVHILAAAHRRVLSPSEFARESGEPLRRVAGHFKRLVEYGALQRVGERQVRGAVEHFYTGTKRAIFTEADWQTLPESVQGGIAGAALQDFVGVTVQAIQSGTFMARDDVVFTWDEVELDEEGMRATIELLELVWKKIASLEEDAATRMAKSGEKPVNAIVGLAGYEAPERRTPPGGVGEEPAED